MWTRKGHLQRGRKTQFACACSSITEDDRNWKGQRFYYFSAQISHISWRVQLYVTVSVSGCFRHKRAFILVYLQLRNICRHWDRWNSQMELPESVPLHCNELVVYYMCEMQQRNAVVCLCPCVCWENSYVLTFPVVFTATRPAVCSAAQTVLSALLWGDAALGFGCTPPPHLFHPSGAPVSLLCLACSFKVLFSFWWWC